MLHTAVLFLRSTLFNLGLWGSTLVIGPLMVCTVILPLRQRYAVTKLWSHFNVWWLNLTCNVRVRLRGIEHLPKEPAVVMAKHQSSWETLYLHALLPRATWVIKRELLMIPLFGWGLYLIGPISIDRASKRKAARQVIQQGKACLNSGQWVVIFPEGTRMPAGTRRHYGTGGARLAVLTGCCVVPVAHNAGEVWARRAYLKYPGTIDVVIGPPISTVNRSAAEVVREVEDWIEGQMAHISNVQPIRKLV